jgi:uncharacterized protein YacL
MKGFKTISALYIFVCAGIGFFIFEEHGDTASYLGLGVGAALGGATLVLGYLFDKGHKGKIAGGLIGMVAGALMGRWVASAVGEGIPGDGVAIFSVFSALAFGYMGTIFGLYAGEHWNLNSLRNVFNNQPEESNKKILDTSVIIDGRIADLCETGFLEGTFIIPQFILRELQHIADSSDPLKRARGRRGMDVLHRIQKLPEVDVRIVDDDFPKIREVDSKIVALAKARNSKVITHDMNLNKVAELQGVTVLNINELCNALKPVVLPGESMRVFVLKEGKEFNQGVAYLDDGTMIVVEDAKRLIGKNVDVVVTSVLQTTAGRMIFAKLKEDVYQEMAVINR